jgi:hypothetical protein
MNGFKKFFEESDVTFEIHDELNPELWDGKTLKPEVREKLLQNAHAWQLFADIPDEAIVDVHMTGGNANYNYTPYSDIDVHLIINPTKIPECDEDLIDDHFRDKKQLWALQHDITVKGHDVELYAEPVDKSQDKPKDQGVYSLINNEWITKPTMSPDVPDEELIKKKTKKMIDLIVSFLSTMNPSREYYENIKNRLRNMRKSGLAKNGEFDINNIVFKELRNSGWLDRMTDKWNSVQDRKLSLN